MEKNNYRVKRVKKRTRYIVTVCILWGCELKGNDEHHLEVRIGGLVLPQWQTSKEVSSTPRKREIKYRIALLLDMVAK